MKKLISVGIFLFLIIIIYVVTFRSSNEYKEFVPPRNTATTLKSLVASLIENEEGFEGNISVSVEDPTRKGVWDRAEIKVLNRAIYDDSTGPREYIAIAERKDEKWRVTHYKAHWKCKRDLLSLFWQITPCS